MLYLLGSGIPSGSRNRTKYFRNKILKDVTGGRRTSNKVYLGFR